MKVFTTDKLDSLNDFIKYDYLLGVVERHIPAGADAFFKKLMSKHLSITGQIRKVSAFRDIRNILNDNIDDEIRAEPFYDNWLFDISEVCKIFCNLEKSEAIDFCLSSQRGCRRYHIDNVPQRMLVTYAGKGTEWLPDYAANKDAFTKGAPNEKIVKDRSALKFMKAWDVAVFRGGKDGLLHRTPDDALNKPSILLRLDHCSYWKNLQNYQEKNGGYIVLR